MERYDESIIDTFSKRIAIAKKVNPNVDELLLATILRNITASINRTIKSNDSEDRMKELGLMKRVSLDALTTLIPAMEAADSIAMYDILLQLINVFENNEYFKEKYKNVYDDEPNIEVKINGKH